MKATTHVVYSLFVPLLWLLSIVQYQRGSSILNEMGTIKVLETAHIIRPPVSDRGDLYVFMAAIAERESRGNDTVVNRYGNLGKYQFSPRTLWAMGKQFKVTREEFLGNAALQDSAMAQYLRDNRINIDDIIGRFNGRWYQGIYITESGLLAGAHLVGPHGLRAFFDPAYTISVNGRLIRPRTIDGNGTSVGEYLSKFSGYTLDMLD
jgi:hypothetical protein